MPIEYKNKVLHLYSLIFENNSYIKKSFDYTISEYERMHDREGKKKNAETIFIQSFYKSLKQAFSRNQLIENESVLNERFQDLPSEELNQWIKVVKKSHFEQIAAIAMFVFFKFEVKEITNALEIRAETFYFRINQVLQNLEPMLYEQ